MQKKRVITVKRGRKNRATIKRSAPAPTHVADFAILDKVATHLKEQEIMRFQPVGVRTTPVSQWKKYQLAKEAEQ